MRLFGLQKLTLLDYPERIACTVFTGGCNLRCPFCHNGSLVLHPSEEVPTDKVLAFAKKRAGILDGICITGGEPTLHADLPDFIDQLRALGLAIKLDTNGTNPAILGKLLAEGKLDYVAMDIKNCKEKYAATIGLADFDLAPILESMRLLRESGVAYEFRTTAVAELHTPTDFAAIGAWITGAPAYYIQNFVDSGDLITKGLHALSIEDMQACLAAVLPFVPNAALRGVSV